MEKRITLDPSVCTLARVAAKPAALSPALASVRLQAGEACATDGRYLLRLQGVETPDEGISLDAKTLRAIEATVRKAKTTAELRNGGPADAPYSAVIRDGKGEESTVKVPAIQEPYPDYSQVIPGCSFKPAASVFLNPSLLRDLADAIARIIGSDKNPAGVWLHVPQVDRPAHAPDRDYPTSPILLESVGRGLLALLMPMRPEDDERSLYMETRKPESPEAVEASK